MGSIAAAANPKTDTQPSRTSHSRREVPAKPIAKGTTHDQLLVLLRQPDQLLGEHGRALAPGAGHADDIGPPEHSLRAEGVVDLLKVAVDVAKRVRVSGMASALDALTATFGYMARASNSERF